MTTFPYRIETNPQIKRVHFVFPIGVAIFAIALSWFVLPEYLIYALILSLLLVVVFAFALKMDQLWATGLNIFNKDTITITSLGTQFNLYHREDPKEWPVSRLVGASFVLRTGFFFMGGATLDIKVNDDRIESHFISIPASDVYTVAQILKGYGLKPDITWPFTELPPDWEKRHHRYVLFWTGAILLSVVVATLYVYGYLSFF